eukprot:271323-Rhodomonas_salina.1
MGLFEKLIGMLETEGHRQLDSKDLSIFARFLLRVILKFPEDKESTVYSTFHQQLAAHLGRLSTEDQSKKEAQQALETCSQVLSGRSEVQIERLRNGIEAIRVQTSARHFPRASEGRGLVLYDGPGSTSQEGVRHSNDFSIMADIS